jgi:hypothetical protein
MFDTCYIMPEDAYCFRRYTATGAKVAVLELECSNYYDASDILYTIMFYMVFQIYKNEMFNYYLLSFILQNHIGQLYFLGIF